MAGENSRNSTAAPLILSFGFGVHAPELCPCCSHGFRVQGSGFRVCELYEQYKYEIIPGHLELGREWSYPELRLRV